MALYCNQIFHWDAPLLIAVVFCGSYGVGWLLCMPVGWAYPTGLMEVLSRMEIKLFLKLQMCCSAAFLLWFPGGTSCHWILFLSISSCRSLDASLSSLWGLGLNPLFVRCWVVFWYACMIDSLYLSGSGSTRIVFGSYAYMTIIYLLPLLDCIGNRSVWSECIFPVGISGWFMDA